MSKVKIRVGDQVMVVAGTNKGAQGEVIKINREKNKAIVAGINMVKKHEKPSATNPQGGIKEKEAPINISNLMLLDSEGKPTRVGYRFEDGKKIRFAKTNNQAV